MKGKKTNTRIKPTTEESKDYFKNKYGIENPFIEIESSADRVFKKPWATVHNPATMCFIGRLITGNLMEQALTEIVYYGQIRTVNGDKQGELSFKSEKEETKEIEHTVAYYAEKNRNK